MAVGSVNVGGMTVEPLAHYLKLGESPPADINRNAIACDGDFIYCNSHSVSGQPGNYVHAFFVQKINPSDMSVVAESSNYDRTINCIILRDGYIYCGGGLNYTGDPLSGRVWKINPIDMSKVAQSEQTILDGNQRGITVLTADDYFIYCNGSREDVYGPGERIKKINPTDLAIIGESAIGGDTIDALVSDGNYLYCATSSSSQTSWTVKKINPEDLSVVAESPAFAKTITSIEPYGGYLFCGMYTGSVAKIDPSDMSVVAESIRDDIDAIDIACYDNYVFCAGIGGKIIRLDAKTLAKSSQILDYGKRIRSLAFDGNYAYCSGDYYPDGATVWKVFPEQIYLKKKS